MSYVIGRMGNLLGWSQTAISAKTSLTTIIAAMNLTSSQIQQICFVVLSNNDGTNAIYGGPGTAVSASFYQDLISPGGGKVFVAMGRKVALNYNVIPAAGSPLLSVAIYSE